MIKIICGAKGSGKTKQLISAANSDLQKVKGLSVFITDNKRCMYDLEREIRFIDVTDYSIAGVESLCGFIMGVAACNSDHEYIYIDGISRITGKGVAELSQLFYMLDKLSSDNSITITVTCSCDISELPEFVKKYV